MELDEFSDDGLDDLTSNVFQELENNAISFTQNRHQTQYQHRLTQGVTQVDYTDYGWDEDEELDTSEIINGATKETFSRPPVNSSLATPKRQQEQQGQYRGPPIPNPRWNPVVDPTNRPNPALAARQRFPGAIAANQPVFGSQRFQTTGQQPTTLGQTQTNQFVKPPLPANRLGPPSPVPSHRQVQNQGDGGDVVSALQQRLRSLEAELNAARGEAAILRANSNKSEQQHTAEVARLKRVNSEQLAKQERMMEDAIADRNTANTELQFMQQDMREATVDRVKRKGSSTAAAGAPITPKKATKSWAMADGFDDIEMISPSKAQGRGKNAGTVAANVGERTPSKGKRKRPTVDSPVMALETHTGDDVVMEEPSVMMSPQPQLASTLEVPIPAPPFEFLQLVLDHAAFHHQPPTFDTLARLALPSEPDTSLATEIFQKLPMMGDPLRPTQLLVDFAELVVSLWKRSFDEQFWDPFRYLVALVAFTFQLHNTTISPLVLRTLSPIAQATVLMLAEGRHRLPDGDLSKSEEYAPLEKHIDTSEVLSLLYVTALACATWVVETDAILEPGIVQFWRLMSLDLVLLCLTPKQRPNDVVAMLDLLATSSLTTSIGPILDSKDPSFVARAVIERVSAKLTETIRTPATPDEKRAIRIAALRTLIAFSRHLFGAQQLASHHNVLPRLVHCLSSTIDELYDQPLPSLGIPHHLNDDTRSSEARATSSELYPIISQCVLLIHNLVTDPKTSNIVDIGQKLSMSYGGSQRYLIALGRLAFAEEDLVIEAGIEGEIVEAAHDLLEMAVTPDEGEVVSEAFGA